MRTWFADPDTRSWTLPSLFSKDDVRLSEFVITRYVEQFTRPGGRVFDPFAGYGTTLVVAERLGRSGEGCEIIKDKADYANSLLAQSRVHHGDVRTLEPAAETFDLILSSPPYMNRVDHEDPLSGYQRPVLSYDAYVAELAEIYRSVSSRLSPAGRLVVQLQNLRTASGVTPLVFDLHAAIGDTLVFLGEEITLWEQDSYGYAHGYCLIYQPK